MMLVDIYLFCVSKVHCFRCINIVGLVEIVCVFWVIGLV